MRVEERKRGRILVTDLFAGATVAGFNRHMEMADRPLAAFIRSLDAHEIMARFGKTMLRHRVTIFGVLFDVAV